MKNNEKKGLVGFSTRFANWCHRWIPDAMVFVLALTLIVVILALVITKSPLLISTESKTSVVDAWVKGFWQLLQFAMQMALIMVTGYVVADSPPVKKIFKRIAGIPKSQKGAIVFAGITTFVMWWLHWGFGMMAGIIMGREILAELKNKGIKVHKSAFVGVIYAITCAAAGISLAAPLFGASPGFLKGLVAQEAAGSIPETIALTQTVLKPTVFLQAIVLAVMTIVVILLMSPKEENDIEEVDDTFVGEVNAVRFERPDRKQMVPSERMNNSPVLMIIIAAMGLFWSIRMLMNQGVVGISIDSYNFMMLMLGVLLQWTPNNFIQSVQGAIGTIWGVVIQFPFYAGIFGIIMHTGLNHVIANAFVSISTQHSFPAVAYLYSSILNFFVPSAGSKFIIEAPYILPAAVELGSDLPAVLSGYTFGDLTTNLIQPFWALPILAMFKMKFNELLPYGFVVAVIATIINVVWMLLLY